MKLGMKHVMIDIETLGTGRDGAIVSIGAVQFDPAQNDLGETFYATISLESEDLGEIDGHTVAWWMQQDIDVRNEALGGSGRQELFTVLGNLSAWVDKIGGQFVWAKPPGFDLRLLREAYARCKMNYPFQFRGELCVRTLFQAASLAGLSRDDCYTPDNQNKHNALSDAIHQAMAVNAAVQALRRQRSSTVVH